MGSRWDFRDLLLDAGTAMTLRGVEEGLFRIFKYTVTSFAENTQESSSMFHSANKRSLIALSLLD